MKGHIGGGINQCQSATCASSPTASVISLLFCVLLLLLSTNFSVPGYGARDHERQQGQRRVWWSSALMADQIELKAALIPWNLDYCSSHLNPLTSHHHCVWPLGSALKLHCRPFPLFSCESTEGQQYICYADETLSFSSSHLLRFQGAWHWITTGSYSVFGIWLWPLIDLAVILSSHHYKHSWEQHGNIQPLVQFISHQAFIWQLALNT